MENNKEQHSANQEVWKKIGRECIYLTIPLKLEKMLVRVEDIVQLKDWEGKRERNWKKE